MQEICKSSVLAMEKGKGRQKEPIKHLKLQLQDEEHDGKKFGIKWNSNMLNTYLV